MNELNITKKIDLRDRKITNLEEQVKQLTLENQLLKRQTEGMDELRKYYIDRIEEIADLKKTYEDGIAEIKQLKEDYKTAAYEIKRVKNTYAKKFKNLDKSYEDIKNS